MPKREFMKPNEVKYVQQNCLTKTDEELAEDLGRDLRTIRACRRRLGIEKGPTGRVQKMNIGNSLGKPDNLAPAVKKLNEEQRKSFFQVQLTNSLFYENLKKQFTDEEIEFYLEEWGALCVQFEDIVATEKRQIDELIQAEIMANRMLRNIKVAEDEIEISTKEVEKIRKSKDIETNEELQERDIQIMNMIRTMHAQCQVMAGDYQKNVDLRNKILSELNARRRDRIDQIKKGGTTFLGLVQALREKEIRESQGRHMELVRLAKQKKQSQWRQPTMYPDGTRDSVIMDEDSIIKEKEIVYLASLRSNFLDEFKEKKDEKIIIIDDDHRRQQFFSDVFKNNKLTFCSNVDKAKEVVTYSDDFALICMDYDLGLGQKGIEFVKYILNKEYCKNSKILVHSMNVDGSEKLVSLIKSKREVEKFPFEDLVKTVLGDNKNA